MNQDRWQVFEERIAWIGDVHVACEALSAPLDRRRMARLRRLNQGILATLGVFAERSSGDTGDDEFANSILLRVDAKLDLLLEIFNQHLSGNLGLPPRQVVRINAKGLLLDGWTPPPSETPVLVSLYFDACLGMPLQLPGRVAESPVSGAGFIGLDDLDDATRQGIEHMVFRQHRRQLAESRRKQKND